jgi:cytochrome c551/c552
MENTLVQSGNSVYTSSESEHKKSDTIKQALENLLDPTSGMSEEEEKAYRNRVVSKLKNGKNLTAEEMNYLQIHDPELYRTAMRVRNQKAILKEQLKHCRSKEQANAIISQTIGCISDKDPDKEYLVAGLREVADKYRKSNQYARLPETEEEAKKKKKRVLVMEETKREDEDEEVTPIQELLDILPTFDVVQ